MWNLRYPGAKTMPGAVLDEGFADGPVAVPGNYTVRLIAGKDTLSRPFEVAPDPRLSTTTDEYRQQFALAQQGLAKLTALTESVLRVQDIQAQVDKRSAQAEEAGHGTRVKPLAKELRGKFEGVRAELYEVYTKADQATLNYPVKLYQQFITLNEQVQMGDHRPTDQHAAIYQDLTQRLTVQLTLLRKLEENDLAAFNKLMQELGLPPVFAAPKKPIM